jgi:predicted nucleic acid-binding protein
VIFIDTSAFYAILDRNDRVHPAARETWTRMLSGDATPPLVTSNYILVETFALVQARLGLAAVRDLNDAMLPAVSVRWVTEQDHAAAVSAVLASNRRSLSLVDCTSFQLMRRIGIGRAFAFDQHFGEQGFQILPAT